MTARTTNQKKRQHVSKTFSTTVRRSGGGCVAQNAGQEGQEQEKDLMKKADTTKEEMGLLAAEYPT